MFLALLLTVTQGLELPFSFDADRVRKDISDTEIVVGEAKVKFYADSKKCAMTIKSFSVNPKQVVILLDVNGGLNYPTACPPVLRVSGELVVSYRLNRGGFAYKVDEIKTKGLKQIQRE